MYFDDELNKIVVKDTCTSCGLCEAECPVGCIMVAKNETEFRELEQDIENDPRTIKDLFVDRYGAAPLSEFFMLESEDFAAKISNQNLTIIELYEDNSIQCLLKSIPIKEITDHIKQEVNYFNLQPTDEIMTKYQITELPALLFFKANDLLGKIEGYFEIDQQEVLITKVKEIVGG